MDLPDKSTPPTELKKVEQVVTGATLVKRPASRRFKDFLMAESPKVLMKRVTQDVLVPRFKAGLEQALNEFIGGMFWGDGANRPQTGMLRGTVLRGGGFNYNGISYQSPMGLAMQANQARPPGTYQDVIVPTQQQAEALLANMFDLLNRYHLVSVADLYEGAGLPTGTSDGSYGWSNLDGARISKNRDGFVLELPRPTIIT